MNEDFSDFFALLNRREAESGHQLVDVDRLCRKAIEDIASKRAAGRPRDLADVSMLEKIRGRK